MTTNPSLQSESALLVALVTVSDNLAARGYAHITTAQIECIADSTRSAEALDMLDHLVARCDLPEALAEPVREWIADNYYVCNR